MRALRWTDVDFTTGKLRIECNEWYGHITTTKGNRVRYVPITGRLREALREHRHLRGARVLYREDGRAMSASALIEAIQRAARRANLRSNGAHILRRTFCSHLAMRNVPARSIQEQELGVEPQRNRTDGGRCAPRSDYSSSLVRSNESSRPAFSSGVPARM